MTGMEGDEENDLPESQRRSVVWQEGRKEGRKRREGRGDETDRGRVTQRDDEGRSCVIDWSERRGHEDKGRGEGGESWVRGGRGKGEKREWI